MLEQERFDVLHLHEPMTPAICVATLAFAQCPVVATWHASGPLRWMKLGLPLWGFLMERIDYRIAVSEPARATIAAWIPGEWEIVPNGTLIPDAADPGNREHRILFVGRHEPRKGLEVLLRAWPDIRGRTGAVLRVIGADPLAVRLLLSRVGNDYEGIEIAGFLSQDDLTRELLAAKAMVAPSLGGESFGMVLTRAFACATPVVASDIGGYREVIEPGTAVWSRRAIRARSPMRSSNVRGRGASLRDRCRGAEARASSATRGIESPAGWRRSTSRWPREVRLRAQHVVPDRGDRRDRSDHRLHALVART